MTVRRHFFPLTLLTLAAAAHAHEGAACQGSAAVAAARSASAAAPESLPALLRLGDTLVDANCVDEAVHVLEAGESRHPRNSELQARLRTARSLLSEQSYFAGLEDAEVAARLSRNLLRCSKLADLNACDEALKLRPNDAAVLAAKGAAQLVAGKPAEAEQALLLARRHSPDDPKIAAQLATAQAQRQVALGSCRKGADDGALSACQVALLRGADDEFIVHTRLAQLYQQRNQPAAALAAYIAANSLRQDDRNVALGIVTLTEANTHRDAVASAARGSALLTLGRGTEALTALRQAQALAPGMPDLRGQISRAEKLAREEPESRATETRTGEPPHAPLPRVAEAAQNAPLRTYSNETEPTRSY